MDYAAIIAAVAGIIGGLYSAGKEDEAQQMRAAMAREFGDDILPDLDKAVAQTAGQSAFQTTPEDTTGRRAELDTLKQLEDEYATGGNTTADLAAYDAARRKVSRAASSKAANASLQAQARGQTGGGLGQVLAAQGSQDELEALASLDAEIANGARGRALNALTAKGAMAGQVRGDDWRALEARLSATDLMNRFNASQKQAAEMYNAQLPNQQFANRMALLQSRNAAQSGVAAGLEAQGANARQTAAGVGNAALSYGQSWDWKQKKDDEK